MFMLTIVTIGFIAMMIYGYHLKKLDEAMTPEELEELRNSIPAPDKDDKRFYPNGHSDWEAQHKLLKQLDQNKKN